MASTAVGVFFCAQGPFEAAHWQRRAPAQTNRKTPEKPLKNGIPGVFLDGRDGEDIMGAARPRPGSHSSRPRKRSIAALDDSIAGRRGKCKGAQRNNAPLER